MADETPLEGGRVTPGVVRVGDTVRRPLSANSPFVHRLLEHLEEVGFEAAPRFVGIDEQGRGMLTFVDGDVPTSCEEIVWRDEQLDAAGRLLRRFHAATALSPLRDTREVVCHGDFGPWNLVWRDDLPVAVIDFDNAAPGDALDDLGYAAWKHLNLGLLDLPVSEQRRRLEILVSSYGARADGALLRSIADAQDRMQGLIEGTADDGRHEALRRLDRERDWLARNGSLLLDQSR